MAYKQHDWRWRGNMAHGGEESAEYGENSARATRAVKIMAASANDDISENHRR